MIQEDVESSQAYHLDDEENFDQDELQNRNYAAQNYLAEQA